MTKMSMNPKKSPHVVHCGTGIKAATSSPSNIFPTVLQQKKLFVGALCPQIDFTMLPEKAEAVVTADCRPTASLMFYQCFACVWICRQYLWIGTSIAVIWDVRTFRMDYAYSM